MKVVIFSSETKHHSHFINSLAPLCDIRAIYYETRHLTKPYPTGPFFADEEDAFEDRFFDPALGGVEAELPHDLAARVHVVEDVNAAAVIEAVRSFIPDLGISYGIGLAKPELFEVPAFGTINVHRGIAEDYRGLDSDLWAVLEGRFDKIGVTIHYMDADLDTGDILAQETVAIEAGDEIFHLRYKTGLVATRLVANSVRAFAAKGKPLQGTVQKVPGPYYTAMSLADKLRAKARFDAYQKELEA